MIQVHIDDRFEVNGLAIHIFERHGDTVEIYQPSGPRQIVQAYQNSQLPTYPFNIPREAAAPLFAELGRLLGSVENPEMLRKDFEHEQRRVDDLTGTLRQLALGLVLDRK